MTKNTQASQDISIRNSLRAFTTNYAATFMSRNIKEFDLLFADGALENGVPFLSLRHKYKQLFSTTQAIEYRIDLLGIEVHEKGATATLTGRFHVRLIYSSNNIEANSGTMTFFLVKNKGSYKINALTYQLDPKRL
ncbi:MAG: nuclear transport factor 2 family protein [Candidatus Electrothrix sp. MAN1_4]|nr:nuclear transport factor 2 family protein [Candidatus Electrothrix sp. MAN1_4]